MRFPSSPRLCGPSRALGLRGALVPRPARFLAAGSLLTALLVTLLVACQAPAPEPGASSREPSAGARERTEQAVETSPEDPGLEADAGREESAGDSLEEGTADAAGSPASAGSASPTEPSATTEAASPPSEEGGIFVDRALQMGLDFTHFNGMTGELYFPEMTGQGGALFDFDRDGDLDVYLVEGAMLGPGESLEDAVFPYRGSGPPRDRLLRNDLVPGSGRPRFTDVTDTAGLRATGYGMGVAVGDLDNDGFDDLYVTNFGSNQLWHNRGDGTFEDITAQSGTDDPRWSTSAAFLDYDGDGWLDLFVANYVAYSVENNIECFAESSRRDYCGPSAFPPVSDRLFHNRGDGTFEDASGPSGILSAVGPGLGVVVADLNGDGRIDIYVANDGQANFLWLNQGDGTFVDEALLAGVAVNREGQAEASMGVDAADFDGDGDQDLFMTHLMGETNTLYINDGTGLFEDRSIEMHLAVGSAPYTSFGTSWFDYDNDGWLDLMILNGAVRILEPRVRAGDVFPLDQPNQLFRNREGRRFEEVTRDAGSVFALEEVSRGAAFGDVDNDGDPDVLVLNNNGPARLLINQVGQKRPWIGLEVLDRRGRTALGARVEIVRPGQPSLWRRVRADGSYCSANDPRVLVGLGDHPQVSAVRVHWPDGSREEWSDLPLRAYTTLRQGTGAAPRKAPP